MLIVGAGPVGLVLGLRLACAGIAVLVVEAEAELGTDLRASTFHPPTLDMLDELELAQALVRQGLITPTWQVRMHETGEYAEFDLATIRNHTRHPYRLQCEQWKLSQLLLDALSRRPEAEVWFGARAEGVAQRDDAVRLVVDRGGERVAAEGAWLVGADGARSAVRGCLELGFEGMTFPETTLLATTDFEFRDHLPHLSGVNYCWAEHGTFSLLRLPEEWRVSLYPDEGETAEQAFAEDAIEAKLQRIVRRAERYRVLRKRPYRIHQRVVERYRVGRVLLAGDAAHVNSPSGGMGMNAGIHDAFSLAEKLARVMHGEPDTLLDLYERQRRPIALEHVLAQSGRNRARMQERDRDRRRQMLRELQAIAADPARCAAHLLRTSMIDGLRQAAGGR